MNPLSFYDLNPISVIDQDEWTDQMAEIAMQFWTQPTIYTPLVQWTAEASASGARNVRKHEMLQGEVNSDPIPFTANYIAALALDSRQRTMSYDRYGDKVQLHKSENIFTQWQKSGGKDWKPLLRDILGASVQRKFEILSRNAFVSLTPAGFATYAGGGTSFADIGATDTFDLAAVAQWRLRLGQTGDPVIPGDSAAASVAVIPPGVEYDFLQALKASAGSWAAMYNEASTYRGRELRYEIGSLGNVRFITHPNDDYGRNGAVLYNAGVISKQYGVIEPVKIGDGAPDPDTTQVDGVWFTGQKDVTHYLQLEDFAEGDYEVNDFVSIHVSRTNAYGITNGNDFLSGRTIVRRVVSVDHVNNRLTFDLPVMFEYVTPMAQTAASGTATTVYAFVTKARHIGMVLVLGSSGAIQADVAQMVEFYEPRPVDDFDSVWRFTWDFVGGWNLLRPHAYEVHFCALSMPKPGGIITP